jgi:hypothetical protein
LFLTIFQRGKDLKNDLPLIPPTEETTVQFLLLVSRATYRARLSTGQALHVADKGEWDIELAEDHVIVSFPRGRILDQKVQVSSLGASPRYYVPLPRACSLTLESALEIKP